MAGLTSEGFTPESLEEIQTRIRGLVVSKFGQQGETVNVNPSSRFGQLIDIFSSEIFGVWEGLEDVYNSYFPLTAFGTSLDKSCQLLNIARLPARSSQGEAYLIGDANTSVPQGNGFLVSGTNNRFNLSSKTRSGVPDTSDYTISEDCYGLSGDQLADSGTLTITFEEEDIVLNHDSTATQIKTILEGHSKINAVDVIGDLSGVELSLAFTPSFVWFKITDSTLTDKSMSFASTLQRLGNDITVSGNHASDGTCNMLSALSDAIVGNKGTIVEPIDVVSGLEFAFNITDSFLGNAVESDPEYRARRYNELARKGTATPNGIKEAVVEAIGSSASNVSIVVNRTADSIPGAVQPNEMPPHSIEVFVNADTDLNNAIAQAIYDSKAAGIEVTSTDGGGRTGLYTDANGKENNVMPISSTVTVPIYIDVDITIDSNYPNDGVQQIKDNLVSFFNGYEIGDDVIQHKLFSPVNLVDGILECSIFIGLTDDPENSDNIAIDAFQTAVTDSDKITVTEL